MAVTFNNVDSQYLPQGRQMITRWVGSCIKDEGFRVGDINFIFCSEQEILRINTEYLGHNYHTDVITFEYRGEEGISGDIFIGVETVRENAQKYGSGMRSEMLRVMIHGVMHLCGYPDKTKAERTIMQGKENDALAKIFG